MKDVFHCSGKRMWINHKVKEGHRSISCRQKRKQKNSSKRERWILPISKTNILLCAQRKEMGPQPAVGSIKGYGPSGDQFGLPIIKYVCPLIWQPSSYRNVGRCMQSCVPGFSATLAFTRVRCYKELPLVHSRGTCSMYLWHSPTTGITEEKGDLPVST